MSLGGHSDLLAVLDKSQTQCLNQHEDHTLMDCFAEKEREDKDKWLQSDADGQILMTIAFGTVSKVFAISMVAPEDKGPSSLKLFANQPNLTFEEAEEAKPAQTIELTPEQLQPGANPLKTTFVKFQKVNSLTIFVPENFEDGDETIINRLVVIGTPLNHEGSKPSLAQQKAAAQGAGLSNPCFILKHPCNESEDPHCSQSSQRTG